MIKYNIAPYFKHTTAFYLFAIMLKTQRLGSTDIESPFYLDTIRVSCTCKYYNMATMTNGKCCKHFIWQLRRFVQWPPIISGPIFETFPFFCLKLFNLDNYVTPHDHPTIFYLGVTCFFDLHRLFCAQTIVEPFLFNKFC